MIEVICRCNLDNFRPTVTRMIAIPNIGDYAECILNLQKTVLKIHRIIHREKQNETRNYEPVPYIEIELGQ